MKLKEYRLLAGFALSGVVNILRRDSKVGRGIDKPLISKAENGIINLTPQQVRILAHEYGCDPTDLYDAQDVDYGHTTRTKAHSGPDKSDRDDIYKLTGRLDLGVATALFDAFGSLGYAGVTDWLRDMARATIVRYRNTCEESTQDGKDVERERND